MHYTSLSKFQNCLNLSAFLVWGGGTGGGWMSLIVQSRPMNNAQVRSWTRRSTKRRSQIQRKGYPRMVVRKATVSYINKRRPDGVSVCAAVFSPRGERARHSSARGWLGAWRRTSENDNDNRTVICQPNEDRCEIHFRHRQPFPSFPQSPRLSDSAP